MTINWIDGKIDGAQAKMETPYVSELVRTMQHGDVAYIDSTDYWVDTDSHIWVDGKASRYSEEDVEDGIDDEFGGMVRVIRIEQGGISGFIIDATATHGSLFDGSADSRLDPQDRLQSTGEYELEPLPVMAG